MNKPPPIQILLENAIAAAKAQGLKNFDVIREGRRIIIRVKGDSGTEIDIDLEEKMKRLGTA